MNKKKQLPSIKFINECFSYNKVTGKIFWKLRPRHHFKSNGSHKKFNNTTAGNEAGHVWVGAHNTYRVVKISGIRYYSHRIIWKLINKTEPDEIDHIDLNSLNNKIENLRSVSPEVNGRNMPKYRTNKSGAKGVYRKNNKWEVQIRRFGKLTSFGFFDSVSAAAKVAEAEFLKLHLK